jgi:hypothetical protein
MTFLLPGERIGGTAAERAHLRLLLTCFRAGPPPMRQATAIARQAAGEAGITDMKPDAGVLGLAVADATGVLTTRAIQAAQASAHPYARALGRFGGTVTARYRALLHQLADDPGELHRQIVAAMTSGDRVPLEAWLDARHGSGCFARLFRARSFGTEPEPIR